jgi:frataxin-like iron-binding protein CyaY
MRTFKIFYKISKKFKFDLNLHQANKPTGVFNKYNKEKSNVYLHYKDIKQKEDNEDNFNQILEETEHNLDKNINSIEISLDEYMKQSDIFFNKLNKSFNELKQYEKNIKIEKLQNSIHITVPKVGVYIIARETQTRLITLTSPLSGLFKYKYDSANNYWISIKDNHIINELVVREFCQHSGGLLIIDN